MFAKILLLHVSVLVTLVAVELVLRLAKPQVFAPHPPGLYAADPDVGYVPAPGFDGWFIQSEFLTRVRVSQSGLRGSDPRPRQANSVLILCLGDSLTWGYGANDEETYPALLEVLLGKRYPELDVQVLNAGVSGYGTDEELEFLRTRGAALEADLVIVLFFAGNDFEDNRSPARVTYEIRDGMLVDKVLGERARSRPRWVRVNDWLKSRSHLHSFVSKRVGYLLMRAGVLGRLEKASSEYFTDEDARHTADLLVEIAQAADRLGASSLFVFAPEKMQVFSDADPPFRAATVVQEAATRAGVPWIDLTPALMQRATRSELYYKRDAHWTPAGNRAVAGVLSHQLGELGLIKPGSKTDHHVLHHGAKVQ